MEANGKGSNGSEKGNTENSSTVPLESKEQRDLEPSAKSADAGKEDGKKSVENLNVPEGPVPVPEAEKDKSGVPFLNGVCVKAEDSKASGMNGVDGKGKDKAAVAAESEVVCASKTSSDKDDDDVILIVEKSNEKANGNQASGDSQSAAEKLEKLAMDVEKYIVASVDDIIEPPMEKNAADKTQSKASESCTTVKEDGEVIETCVIGNPIICGKATDDGSLPKEIPLEIKEKDSEKGTTQGLVSENNVTKEKVGEQSASDTIKSGEDTKKDLKPDVVDHEEKNANTELPDNSKSAEKSTDGQSDKETDSSPSVMENPKTDTQDPGVVEAPITETTASNSEAVDIKSSELKPEATSSANTDKVDQTVEDEPKTDVANNGKVTVEEKLERSESSSAVKQETMSTTSSGIEKVAESSTSESSVRAESNTLAETTSVERSESLVTNDKIEETKSLSAEKRLEQSREVSENIVETSGQITRETSSKSTVSQISQSSTSVERTQVETLKLSEEQEAAADLNARVEGKVSADVEAKTPVEKADAVAESKEMKPASAASEASKSVTASEKETIPGQSGTAAPQPAKEEEEGHDSGVDETTQSQNGESASPPKGGRASPRKRQPRSMDPSPMKRLSGSTTSVERKKVPMNKIEVGKSASPNLKQVKSKIGSLNNTSYKPGGGNVKIESKKLDYSKASSRIAAKNEEYKPRGGDKKIESQKLKWNAQSKVGSLENTTHKPGGGTRKIESQKLNFKDSAQSKVGSRENIKHKPGGGDVQIQEQRLDFKEKASSKVGSLKNVTHRPGGGEKRIFDDKEYLRQRSNESRSPCKTPSSVPGSEYSMSRPETPDGTNPVSQATSGLTSPQPDVTSPQPAAASPQPAVTSPQPTVTSPPPAEA